MGIELEKPGMFTSFSLSVFLVCVGVSTQLQNMFSFCVSFFVLLLISSSPVFYSSTSFTLPISYFCVCVCVADGYSDGVFHGIRYFKCEEKRGMFVRTENVIPYTPEAEAAVRIQRILRGHVVRNNKVRMPFYFFFLFFFFFFFLSFSSVAGLPFPVPISPFSACPHHFVPFFIPNNRNRIYPL